MDRAQIWQAYADTLTLKKKLTHPTPGGFRGLNCLARLAVARERTPSELKQKYKTMSKYETSCNVLHLSAVNRHTLSWVKSMYFLSSTQKVGLLTNTFTEYEYEYEYLYFKTYKH